MPTSGAHQGLISGHLLQLGPGLQRGVAPLRARDLFDEVVEGLGDFAAGAKVGPGLDPSSDFGPLVSEEQFDRVNGYIDSGLEEGATAVAGGLPENGGRLLHRADPFHRRQRRDADRARGDLRAGLGGDALRRPRRGRRRANDTDYGLAAGLWTRDISKAHKLAGMLEAGNVYINTWGGGDPAAPFGGYKASGIGREKGHANLEAYLETKTVWAQL